MLSPKTPKHCPGVAGELLLLDQYDCMVDELALQDSLDDVVTQLESDDDILSSRPFGVHNLPSFFIRCVQACHDALNKHETLHSVRIGGTTISNPPSEVLRRTPLKNPFPSGRSSGVGTDQ